MVTARCVEFCPRFKPIYELSHVVAMERVMQFCLCSKDKGLKLKPSGVWDGNKSYKLNIHGRSNSDYAKQVEVSWDTVLT